MTINRITDTAIANKTYHGRSIQPNNLVDKRFIRQANGTLWAALPISGQQVQILKSVDDGFTWTIARQNASSSLDLNGVDGENTDGPILHIEINERFNKFDLYASEWNSVGSDYDMVRDRYELDDVEASTAVSATIVAGITGGAFVASGNLDQLYLTYLNDAGGSNIFVKRASPRSTATSSAVSMAITPVFNMHATVVDEAHNLHVIFAHQTGGENILKHIIYHESTGWGSASVIDNLGVITVNHRDISVALDGYGNLAVVYGVSGSGFFWNEWAYSVSDGVSWSVVALTQTSDHADYTDAITSDVGGHTRIIGSQDGGFMFMYTEDDSSGVPKTYLRQITTANGGLTYSLGAEKQIATSEATAAVIPYATFFYPTDTKLMDFRDPGLVRIAYQVGEGDSAIGEDEQPVDVKQELLFASAFPTSLTSESGSYAIDIATSTQLHSWVNILSGPSDNSDYFTLGMVGNFTRQYQAAIKKMGTAIRLQRYEPDADNLMNDRTAYDKPVESGEIVLFDPQTYVFPVPDLNNADTTAFIERDVRKLWLPPTKPLARTFLVNAGGFLKRTVWTCQYGGNEYELSQVVPRFIANQICYYEANAYVMGPSRNPFSRSILPSET